MADEEDEAIPNDGSLVPFLALLMIYEFFSLHPPANTWEVARRRPRPSLSYTYVHRENCSQDKKRTFIYIYSKQLCLGSDKE